MEVIRDSCWAKCFENAKRMCKNEKDAGLLADCNWRMKKRYEQHYQRREQKMITVIDKVPSLKQVSQTVCKSCVATTMTGKKCGFRAVCGDFCKKHKVSAKVVLGNKC